MCLKCSHPKGKWHCNCSFNSFPLPEGLVEQGKIAYITIRGDGNIILHLCVHSPTIGPAVALLCSAPLCYRHTSNIQQVPVELITSD